MSSLKSVWLYNNQKRQQFKGCTPLTLVGEQKKENNSIKHGEVSLETTLHLDFYSYETN